MAPCRPCACAIGRRQFPQFGCRGLILQWRNETIAPYAPSEIRLARDRNLVVEQMLVVLGADVLAELLRCAPKTSHGGPGLDEGVGVLDRESRFHHLAGVGNAPALDDVQLLAVRGAVI